MPLNALLHTSPVDVDIDSAAARSPRDLAIEQLISMLTPLEQETLEGFAYFLVRSRGGGHNAGVDIPEVVRRNERFIRCAGQLEIDPESSTVFCRATPVRLSPICRRFLVMLARAGGNMVPTSRLLHELWPNVDPLRSRALSQCVYELRRKLETNPRQPRFIRTHHREGFSLLP